MRLFALARAGPGASARRRSAGTWTPFPAIGRTRCPLARGAVITGGFSWGPGPRRPAVRTLRTIVGPGRSAVERARREARRRGTVRRALWPVGERTRPVISTIISTIIPTIIPPVITTWRTAEVSARLHRARPGRRPHFLPRCFHLRRLRFRHHRRSHRRTHSRHFRGRCSDERPGFSNRLLRFHFLGLFRTPPDRVQHLVGNGANRLHLQNVVDTHDMRSSQDTRRHRASGRKERLAFTRMRQK